MIWTFDQEVSNRGPPAGMRRFGNVAFFSRRPKPAACQCRGSRCWEPGMVPGQRDPVAGLAGEF
jgi:hypothetical protein